MFEQDFSQLAHALVESLGAPNADIPVIFEAIASLVNAQENIDPIKPLVPFILQSLQQNFDDAVVVATAVIRKLKQDLEPYADQFMSLYVARFPNNVSEDVLMAIGYTAQGTIKCIVTPLILSSCWRKICKVFAFTFAFDFAFACRRSTTTGMYVF